MYDDDSPLANAPLDAIRRPALVHDWLTGMRGGEKVLEELAGLFPSAPIYTLFHFDGSVSEALESHPIRTSYLQKAPGLRRWYRHYLPLYPSAAEDLDLAGHDLVVSSSHCVAKGILPPPGAFHACYIHTPMRYAWDQERQYFPRRTGLLARLRALILSGLRAWDVTSSRRVDLFIANSRFVAERVRRYYRRDADVVHPPVDVEFFQPGDLQPGQDTEREGYCLIVAALAPYKRLDVAIRACETLGLPLRIVGTGPEEGRLRRLAGPQTRFLGRVDGAELRRLYQGARCLLQPGVEDFGIAPVEALACGTPVVAHGRGGVLDIVESGVHGVLYTPPPETTADVLDEASTQAHAAALGAAIDKLGEIQFNILNLRSRAEDFSAPQFRRLIWSSISEGLSRAKLP